GLLGADTMLTVSAGSDAALAGAMRRLWLAVPVAGMILDEAATATMMEAIAHGQVRAGDLVSALPPERRPLAWRTLAWLAKTGLLRWRNAKAME
ncbi:MAG TPA: hypothetical protein VET85_00415, partial [Stellaceae bacterium]|nr:hypothetical protein [Stellaceae bacterium]